MSNEHNHEAKAAPAVPEGDLASVTEIETVIDWCVTSYMPMPSNEHAALLVDRLRHLRATPAAQSQEPPGVWPFITPHEVELRLGRQEVVLRFVTESETQQACDAIIAALREKEQTK